MIIPVVERPGTWIDDTVCVEMFLKRAQDCLNAPVEFERTFVRSILNAVTINREYSTRQDWALQKVEEFIQRKASQQDPNNQDTGFFSNCFDNEESL